MGLVVNAETAKRLIDDYPADWQSYTKKPSPVLMTQIQTEAEVQTDRGVQPGHPGDWLCWDEKSGICWIITNEYKNMHYEPSNENATV